MDFIRDFFDWLVQLWNVGIYELITGAVAWALVKVTIWFIEFKLWSLQFAWSVAQGVLTQLNLSQVVDTAFASLSLETRDALQFFRVPECINWLASSVVSRFVLRMIPFA